MSDRLSIKEIESYIAAIGDDDDFLPIRIAKQLADTMRREEKLKAMWFPLLDYLQDNPGIIGARLGDCISKKLLEYLKRNKDSDNV